MSRGRPIQFDPDWALNAATTAFWSKGYEATSMQDLLGATGLSKSSLYQAFGGKPELFCRCMARYAGEMVHHLHERLRTTASTIEFLRATLMQIAGEGGDTATPRGCLIMNTAAEFGQRNPAFAECVGQGIGRIRAVFQLALSRGQKAGEIRLEPSAAMLADYVISSIAGIRTMVKAGARPRSLHAIIDIVVDSLRP